MHILSWISAYKHAWETASVPEIVSIFTSNAAYRAFIFQRPHVGHAAISTYWQNGPGSRKDIKVRMGTPFTSGDRTTVEFWATMTDPVQGEFTLAGCLLLKFDKDGLCEDLREYWNKQEGWHDPPKGWGV